MLNALKRFAPWSDAPTISLSLAHEAKWLTQSVDLSPDYGYLEQKEFQLYFATDDLKTGHSRYSLGEGVTLCTGYTQKNYNFWYQEEGEERTPVPMLATKEHSVRFFPPPLKIQGELQLVKSPRFREIDDYKRNTKQFRRQRTNILVPYRNVQWHPSVDVDGTPLPRPLQGKNGVHSPEHVYVIRAWMYVGIPEYWDDVLDAGFRGFKTVRYVESRRPWLKEYYAYPKQGFK